VAQPYFSGFTPVGPQVSLCKIPEKLSFLVQQGVPLSKSENIFTKGFPSEKGMVNRSGSDLEGILFYLKGPLDHLLRL
jgi:hypothetical protein